MHPNRAPDRDAVFGHDGFEGGQRASHDGNRGLSLLNGVPAGGIRGGGEYRLGRLLDRPAVLRITVQIKYNTVDLAVLLGIHRQNAVGFCHAEPPPR